MNKNLTAVAIGIAVVIVGLVLFASLHSNSKNSTSTQNQTASPTPAPAPANQNTNPAPNPSANPTNPSDQQAAGAVTIKNMAFTPSQITVKKGSTVTWTNQDSIAHTVTDDLADAGGPNSGNIQPGGTYSFTFDKTGSFQYHCTIHPSMRGTIVVN
jgi:plastocyanin